MVTITVLVYSLAVHFSARLPLCSPPCEIIVNHLDLLRVERLDGRLAPFAAVRQERLRGRLILLGFREHLSMMAELTIALAASIALLSSFVFGADSISLRADNVS